MKVLNLYALAKELRLPAAWLKEQAISGRIPCLKIGRRLRFNRVAVERALAILAGAEQAEKQLVAHRRMLLGATR